MDPLSRKCLPSGNSEGSGVRGSAVLSSVLNTRCGSRMPFAFSVWQPLFPGGTALPFVISTEGNCGREISVWISFPKMLPDRKSGGERSKGFCGSLFGLNSTMGIRERRSPLPLSNYSFLEHRLSLCHLDRSESQWRDLRVDILSWKCLSGATVSKGICSSFFAVISQEGDRDSRMHFAIFHLPLAFKPREPIGQCSSRTSDAE